MATRLVSSRWAKRLQTELETEIESALGELPPKLRSAIVLTKIQELDIREAAAIERCSAATIYWRIHRARKLLEQRLDRYLSS